MRRSLPAAVLLALGLLWALDSLRSDLWPGPFRAADRLPFFEHETLRWAVLALASLALVRRRSWPSKRTFFHCALIVLGLFVVPAVLIHAAGANVPALTRVALFTLTPLFAVIFEPFFGEPLIANARGAFAAALALAAGALFLFPFTLPGSSAQALAEGVLLLTVALIAALTCRAVRIARSSNAPSLPGWIFVCTAAAVISFSVISLISQPPVPIDWRVWPSLLWTLLIDFPALVGFFWLLPRLSATRITLRFVLAPLFAALMSLIAFTPSVSLSAAVGLALMAAGAVWILLGPDGLSSSSTLLGLDADDQHTDLN